MSSFGPDKVILPSGTTANRPASPSNGLMRYNTTLNAVEMYTSQGWIIGGDKPGTITNPAQSGQEIYNAGLTTSGLYWFAGDTYGAGDGNQFQMQVDHGHGGGWININKSAGPYGTILTSGFGSGGSDILSGAATDTISAINCNNSTQNQAGSVGCSGANEKAYVDLASSFASDFSISEVRMKITMQSHSSVTCGPYWDTVFSSGLTIISGASGQVYTRCNNSPNTYSEVANSAGSAPFTVEFYGTLASSTRLVQTWTACGGNFIMTLRELYVR